MSIDNWMNISLKQVISTSRVIQFISKSLISFIKDGAKFFKIPEVYIRGTFIKYLRVEDEMLEKAKEAAIESEKRFSGSRSGASDRGGRGGSRGGDRGRGGRGGGRGGDRGRGGARGRGGERGRR